MFEEGDHVMVRFRGEPHLGVIKTIKWGLAYIRFDKRQSQWVDIKYLSKGIKDDSTSPTNPS